jgi:hypothetical protein
VRFLTIAHFIYWRGHVSIGKSNEILAVSSAKSGAYLLVKSLVQQTTLTQYIRAVTTVAYNSSVLSRAKIHA